MKDKLLLTTALAVLNITLFAQGWKVAGNALTSTGQIGSTNAQDIKFITAPFKALLPTLCNSAQMAMFPAWC